MMDEPQIQAYTAKVCDLPAITAISTQTAEYGYRRWVKDVIPMPDDLCMVLIAKQGNYPYMDIKWGWDIGSYLPEIHERLIAQGDIHYQQTLEWKAEQKARAALDAAGVGEAQPNRPDPPPIEARADEGLDSKPAQ